MCCSRKTSIVVGITAVVYVLITAALLALFSLGWDVDWKHPGYNWTIFILAPALAIPFSLITPFCVLHKLEYKPPPVLPVTVYYQDRKLITKATVNPETLRLLTDKNDSSYKTLTLTHNPE